MKIKSYQIAEHVVVEYDREKDNKILVSFLEENNYSIQTDYPKPIGDGRHSHTIRICEVQRIIEPPLLPKVI